MTLDMEAALLAHIGDGFTSVPIIDPWAAKYGAPEPTMVKARLALPAPVEAVPEPPEPEWTVFDSVLSMAPYDGARELAALLATVATITKISGLAMLGPRHYKNICRARMIFCFATQYLPKMTMTRAGKFCDRDRTTINHARGRVKNAPEYFEPELSAVLKTMGVKLRLDMVAGASG